MLSQKHSDAKKVNYKSGFFITTNILPDFGVQRDQEAVYKRLKVFHTRPLPKKDSSVTGTTLFYNFTTLLYTQYVSNKIKQRQRDSFISVLFYWIHTV